MKSTYIMIISIITIYIITGIAYVQNGYSAVTFYIECPETEILGCENIYYNNPTDFISRQSPEFLCEIDYRICNQERLSPGEVLGTKPQGIMKHFYYYLGTILTITAIALWIADDSQMEEDGTES